MLQINMDTNSHILHQVKTTFYGPCHLLCYLICIVVNYLSLSCLGKFYLVDFGYPNRLGYLAPYNGVKYHLLEFKQGPRPGGRNEVFNFHRSSLCNVRVFFRCLEDEMDDTVKLTVISDAKANPNNSFIYSSS
jgi:hypothetical protein